MPDPMPEVIAIIGIGRVGRTLARRLMNHGSRIVLGTRDVDFAGVRLTKELRELDICHYSQAVQQSNLVILCIPWDFAESIVSAIGDWHGRVLVDCTNPLNRNLDGLTTESGSSAAEQIATWAIGADVVKAFNTVGTDLMANPVIEGEPVSMLYCGDSLHAKACTASVISTVGFEPIDCGPLKAARYLEPLAMMYIDMARRQSNRERWGFRMLRGQ